MTLDPLSRGRALVADADRVLVLTGAGVSQESGVPTFRGADGLWRSFRAEELATPQAFDRDPALVWEWYRWRRRRIAPCRPNPAHEAIARFLAARGGATLVTQNVDGLHDLAQAALEPPPPAEAAGPSSPHARILHLHGSLFRSRCTRCDYARDEPRAAGPSHDATDAGDDVADAGTLPTCPACGALLRPDVVWFGESLDPAILGAAWRAAEEADLCLVVGTSGVVQPAASLAGVTRGSGGAVVEVNPEPTPLSAVATLSVRASAADAVPTLLADADATAPERPRAG